MNKLLPYILLLFLCSCSKSPEEKARAMIKPFLNRIIPNIESYDAIEYGPLTPAKLNYYITFEYKILEEEFKAIEEEAKSLNKDFEEDLEWMKIGSQWHTPKYSTSEYEIQMDSLLHQMKSLADSIERENNRFTYDSTMVCMFHKFRYYDEKMSRHLIVPITFYFDKDVKEIKGITILSDIDEGENVYCDLAKMTEYGNKWVQEATQK